VATHVRVGASVDLMRVPAGILPADQQNVNVFGETGSMLSADIKHMIEGLPDSTIPGDYFPLPPGDDVRNPDMPETLSALNSMLRPILASPGLSVLVFRPALAPGYDWWMAREPGVSPAGCDFGYTVENRLSFLRQEGYDPIDFDMGNSNSYWHHAALLPYISESENIVKFRRAPNGTPYPDMTKEREKWCAFRIHQQNRLLETLQTAITKRRPDLRLYVSLDGYNEWTRQTDYQKWHAGEVLVEDTGDLWQRHRSSTRDSNIPTCRFKHEDYHQALASGEYPVDLPESGLLAVQLRDLMRRREPKATRLSGILDLTSMPVSEAIPLIEGALAPKSK